MFARLGETIPMDAIYSYLLHLFGPADGRRFRLHLWRVTPFQELALIRQGIVAPALSLGGAAIGFSLTVASSILHNDSYPMFLFWSASA